MSDREAATAAASGDAHAAAADAFVERATAQAGNDIVDLYVFGSTIHGETRGLTSDVDVLIVLGEASLETTADALRDIAYDVMLEYGPVVELHVLSESGFERARSQGNPLIQRVVRRDRPVSDDGPDEPAIETQLQQAQQALADAEGARDADLSEAVIVNRLYYACFHAAQAVLYDRGFEPTSHGGVLSLFGSEVVTAGDTSRERGRFLNRLSELRRQADYGHGEIDEDLDALLKRTREFVTEKAVARRTFN